MRGKLLRITPILLLVSAHSLAQERAPVIDVHLHVWNEAWFPAFPHGYEPETIKAAASQEELIASTIVEMDEHGVVLALVSEVPEGMERLVSQDRKRLLSYAMFDSPSLLPGAKPLDLEELESKLTSGAWHGIGELPIQYGGLSPTDDLLWPYYELAERLQVPVFAHTGLSFPGITRMDPAFRADLGRPLQWEEVLVRHPDLKLVLMHAGWPFLDEMMAVMHLYPNVYVDTGAIVHLSPKDDFYRYFGVLIDSGLGDRILFGSDQMGWPEAIGYAIERIKSGPWSDEVKRDILYNNATRFLALSDEEIARHQRE